MDDLVRWLGEQLDEDDRVARAAGGDAWRRQEHASDTVAIYDSKGEPVVYDEGWPTEEQQAHIIRHDPSRALRETDRKRQMLRDADDFCAEYDAEIDDDNSAAQRAYCWRDTIRRNFAAEYAHRPGYLAEWAPTD